MCRSTTENGGDFAAYSKDCDRLKIRAFHLRLSISPSSSRKLPETLTLVYLPRINGNPLEINGAKIRPDSTSLVALHRARSMDQTASEAVYASTDRVQAGEAVRFEAYIGSEKAIKGVFRRSGGIWGLECKSADLGRLGIAGAEVWVGGERGVLMRERVEVERSRKRGFCSKLEEIVEEGEREGCDCCSCFCDDDDDEDEEEEGESEEWEMVERGEEEEMEGVKWAVEMGIWVMFVGVGYLVSKASYRGLRRRRII